MLDIFVMLIKYQALFSQNFLMYFRMSPMLSNTVLNGAQV